MTVVRPLSLPELAAFEAAVAVAVRDRLGGSDAAHREHALQAALSAAGAAVLGLRDPMYREYPGWRPVAQPAFLDFLGHDGNALHVVETKLGNDAMLTLQALDYWTWVTAHQEEIGRELRLAADRPPQIDLVVAAPKAGEPPLGPYTLPQLEALDGGIRWRVHVATLDGATVTVQSAAPRRMPAEQDAGQRLTRPRHATRLQSALLEDAGLGSDASPVLRDAEANVLPAARDELRRLVAAGLDHRFVGHVRSSQAFALNLFAPLDDAARLAVLRLLGLDAVTVEPAVFEFSDPADQLGESTAARPHHTQVDVLLRGRNAAGLPLLALMEVKLSEIDFGHCSAFGAVGNDRRDVCRSAGAFGGEPGTCFQLRNHDLGQRRRYDEHLDRPALRLLDGAADGGGCLVRLGLNQPMRNVALARVLSEAESAEPVYALCAPAGHRTIWRRWSEAETAFGDQDVPTLRRLPAEEIVPLHPDGARLADRYRLSEQLRNGPTPGVSPQGGR